VLLLCAAEQRAEEQYAERGSENPERQHPHAPPDVIDFPVSLRGEFQGRVNRRGDSKTALAER
jgi:hypothetical protein